MQRVKVEVEPTRSALATAMLSSKQHLRPRAVVGYGIKIFVPRPLHYVTRSPGYFTYKSRDALKLLALFITVKAIAKLNLGHRNQF